MLIFFSNFFKNMPIFFSNSFKNTKWGIHSNSFYYPECKDTYACNAGDPGSISGLERSPGEGKDYPLHILAWRIPWTS